MFTILQLLADGRFHSGQAICDKLGVSRTAVWKLLRKVQALGLSVDCVSGKGYRLQGGCDLLCKETIIASLESSQREQIEEVKVFSSLDSTNQYLLDCQQSSAKPFRFCLAEMQTAGRGRHGRTWHSPFAANLYLSCLWQFAGTPSEASGLSLAVACAIAEQLSSMGIEGVQLKWPNDIFIEDKKLGGILIEMMGDAAGPCQLVVGIGLNVNMPSMSDVIDQPWCDMMSNCSSPISRNDLASKMITTLIRCFTQFMECGFAAFHDTWQRYDKYYQQQVALQLPYTEGANPIVGIGMGVTAKGELQLQVGDSLQVFNGGELRVQDNLPE